MENTAFDGTRSIHKPYPSIGNTSLTFFLYLFHVPHSLHHSIQYTQTKYAEYVAGCASVTYNEIDGNVSSGFHFQEFLIKDIAIFPHWLPNQIVAWNEAFEHCAFLSLLLPLLCRVQKGVQGWGLGMEVEKQHRNLRNTIVHINARNEIWNQYKSPWCTNVHVFFFIFAKCHSTYHYFECRAQIFPQFQLEIIPLPIYRLSICFPFISSNE